MPAPNDIAGLLADEHTTIAADGPAGRYTFGWEPGAGFTIGAPAEAVFSLQTDSPDFNPPPSPPDPMPTRYPPPEHLSAVWAIRLPADGLSWTAGAAWNLKNPKRPTADLDAQAVRDIPVNCAEWLADMGGAYSGHEVQADGALTVAHAVMYDNDVLVIRAAATGAAVAGGKCRLRIRLFAGGQIDDKTLWLRIVEN